MVKIMTIKHPIPKKKYEKKDRPKSMSYTSNLGMTLESDVEETNLYYLKTKRAVIYKKPTPVQIVDVSYPSRNKAKIVEAYYRTPSTTDFNGIYKGYYIDFDCKEKKVQQVSPCQHSQPSDRTLKNIVDAGESVFNYLF